MKTAAVRLGDAILRCVLPRAEAGACVPGAGQPCKCASPCGQTWCTQYFLNCNGVCKSGGVHC